MKHNNQKKRGLAKAGIVHAAGWVRETDKPAFDKLVSKAKADVDRVTQELRDK